MELITPSIGLFFFQTILFSGVLFFAIAWIFILMTNKLDATSKLVWLLGTLCLPVIGPMLFFIKFFTMKKA